VSSPSCQRPAELTSLRDRLAADVERLASRLRGLSGPRLAQQVPPYGTRAAAGRRAAQILADLAQGVDQPRGDIGPGWREVPEVGDFVVGDQVAVCGHDAVAALDALLAPRGLEDRTIWTRDGRRSARAAVSDALEVLKTLRLAIN